MGFGLDVRGADYRDEQAEPAGDCFTCEKNLYRGPLCPECGVAVEEGREA